MIIIKNNIINKSTAFSYNERNQLHLLGLLPEKIENIDIQAQRSIKRLRNIKKNIEKYVYLRNIYNINKILFYYLFKKYIYDILPIVYTPTIGIACKKFSDLYLQSTGIFISYPNRNRINKIFKNINLKNIKIIVITDGERILGLGDLGVGGIEIVIGKLSLYTIFAGINPIYTLPIILDVGTNNETLLNDPLYLGWKNYRIVNKKYKIFLEKFIYFVTLKWPNLLIHFEDFGQKNANFLLKKYKNKICCFNDDIQGTAAITLSILINAMRFLNNKLKNKKIVIVGAGSAGVGIAKQIINYTMLQGLNFTEAKNNIYLIDKIGLLTEITPNILDFQKNYLQKKEVFLEWNIEATIPSLLEVIKNVKPNILIGVSGIANIFNKKIIIEMYKNCSQPIIMPLSNPNSCMEANPKDLIKWTEGNAIIATGSPISPIKWNNKIYKISQCNNIYIFPGIGLGSIISKTQYITNNMIYHASMVLSKFSPIIKNNQEILLPKIEEIENISKKIALKIALEAQKENIAPSVSKKELQILIEKQFWVPKYI